MGGPGRFEMSEIDRDYLHLERVDEDKVSVSSGTNAMVLSSHCPACKYDYAGSEDQLCPECGSKKFERLEDNGVKLQCASCKKIIIL